MLSHSKIHYNLSLSRKLPKFKYEIFKKNKQTCASTVMVSLTESVSTFKEEEKEEEEERRRRRRKRRKKKKEEEEDVTT